MAVNVRSELRGHYSSLPVDYFDDLVERWLDGRLTLDMTTDLLIAERQRQELEAANSVYRPLVLIFGSIATAA